MISIFSSDSKVSCLPIARIGKSGLKFGDQQNHPIASWRIGRKSGKHTQRPSISRTHGRVVAVIIGMHWKEDYMYVYVESEARKACQEYLK